MIERLHSIVPVRLFDYDDTLHTKHTLLSLFLFASLWRIQMGIVRSLSCVREGFLNASVISRL